MKIAYCDCVSGVSGDMFLGALLDLGLPLEGLKQALGGLGLEQEYELRLEEVQRGPFRAAHFRVHQPEKPASPPPQRHLADIAALIEASGLPAPVQQTALAVFTRLAEAEARVHGQPVEQVHFHEVGAVDSIIDILGAAWGLHTLGIEKLYASSLPLGGGETLSRHGRLPLPAPATLELLAAAGAPVRPAPGPGELVTPTGAALLAGLAEFRQPAMQLERIGVGAGTRQTAWPNILRLWLGRVGGAEVGEICLLETNLDDLSPEQVGFAAGELFAAGALDVFTTPIFMKKNRPASLLSVIARPEQEAEMAGLLLRHTSTLGVRVQRLRRYEAGRRLETVDTPFGPAVVKVKLLDGRPAGCAPEYESCAELARRHGVPLAEVYTAALLAWGQGER
jgi:pyridinium-3,5-bisthiocarboxylic acid mononucleotide nickel chelatase